MQNSRKLTATKNGLRSSRFIPDYTGDYYNAKVLAKRIQNYWLRAGYPKVKTWVETEITYSGNKLYSVRSNIRYNVNDLME